MPQETEQKTLKIFKSPRGGINFRAPYMLRAKEKKRRYQVKSYPWDHKLTNKTLIISASNFCSKSTQYQDCLHFTPCLDASKQETFIFQEQALQNCKKNLNDSELSFVWHFDDSTITIKTFIEKLQHEKQILCFLMLQICSYTQLQH